MAYKYVDWVSLRVKFLNCDLNLKQFADLYDISHSALRAHAGKQKWLKERERLNDEGITVKGGEHVIKQISQLLLLVKDALMAVEDNPNYFYTSDRMPNLNKINAFLSTYKELEKLVKSSFDILPKNVQKQIELNIEKLELRKQELGDIGEVIGDNFIEALKEAGNNIWSE